MHCLEGGSVPVGGGGGGGMCSLSANPLALPAGSLRLGGVWCSGSSKKFAIIISC